MEKKELPAVGKKKIPSDKGGVTGKGNWYFPLSDIYGTPDTFPKLIDMPGAGIENLNIDPQDQELVVNGEVSQEAYTDERVVYNEYNIGHYHRHFVISEAVNRDKIEAKMSDGVLSLILPKAEHIKPRKIEVKAE